MLKLQYTLLDNVNLKLLSSHDIEYISIRI